MGAHPEELAEDQHERTERRVLHPDEDGAREAEAEADEEALEECLKVHCLRSLVLLELRWA